MFLAREKLARKNKREKAECGVGWRQREKTAFAFGEGECVGGQKKQKEAWVTARFFTLPTEGGAKFLGKIEKIKKSREFCGGGHENAQSGGGTKRVGAMAWRGTDNLGVKALAKNGRVKKGTVFGAFGQ